MTRIFLTIASTILCLIVGSSNSASAKPTKEEEIQQDRIKIDDNEKSTINRLFKENPNAKELYGQSYGYAVFHGTQTAFMISGGGGTGVAINKKSGNRTYMRMASAGAGLGLGVQILNTVFLFQT